MPPPLSGSSLMPLDNQVDQATGIAEFSVPHTTIMAATPQSEWPSASSPIVTAANAIGSPQRSDKRCRPTKAVPPYVPAIRPALIPITGGITAEGLHACISQGTVAGM